jgi:sulfoxide reductase heme-binding subunit YedZ
MVMAIKSPLYMQEWTLKNIIDRFGKPFVFLLSISPLIRLIWFGVNNQLSANPIEFITRFTGTWAIVFLCLTLTITPLRVTTGWNVLIKYRRMLGLFCFFYACLHFSTWLFLDQQLDFSAIYQDFYKRTFITLGLAGFILLIPLAVTSTKSLQRKLGRSWAKLHSLIYLIAILVILHYYVHKAAKNNFGEVIIYIIILGALLAWRIGRWFIRKNAQINAA